jgi:hypothetical protein
MPAERDDRSPFDGTVPALCPACNAAAPAFSHADDSHRGLVSGTESAEEPQTITKRSQCLVGCAEIAHLLRQRTVHNNGVVPQQAALALRLLIEAAAVPAPLADGTRATA